MEEKIIELFKKGIPITTISKQFNCHTTTIKYILAKEKLYGNNINLNSDIIEEYINGYSLTSLSKKYKCSRQNISIFLLYNVINYKP